MPGAGPIKVQVHPVFNGTYVLEGREGGSLIFFDTSFRSKRWGCVWIGVAHRSQHSGCHEAGMPFSIKSNKKNTVTSLQNLVESLKAL